MPKCYQAAPSDSDSLINCYQVLGCSSILLELESRFFSFWAKYWMKRAKKQWWSLFEKVKWKVREKLALWSELGPSKEGKSNLKKTPWRRQDGEMAMIRKTRIASSSWHLCPFVLSKSQGKQQNFFISVPRCGAEIPQLRLTSGLSHLIENLQSSREKSRCKALRTVLLTIPSAL